MSEDNLSEQPETPEPESTTVEPEHVESDSPDVREELLEAVNVKPVLPIRRPIESQIEGIQPLEPLEPMTSDDYADLVGDAMDPSKIMPPLMPIGETTQEPVQRLHRFTHSSKRSALQFSCPYGFEGQCCGCRYLPCNELTLAILEHVSRDYMTGGRCSA